jgi:serine/threonine-protein kinase RsbW
MELMENHKIVFSSKPENLVKVEKMVEDICDELQIAEDLYGNILVALTEAVNNGIQHGNKSNPNKKIMVSFQAEDSELQFLVKDEGHGFDPGSVPDPTDPANIEKPNGRGVFLMKNLADKVEFKENGCLVQLYFKLN